MRKALDRLAPNNVQGLGVKSLAINRKPAATGNLTRSLCRITIRHSLVASFDFFNFKYSRNVWFDKRWSFVNWVMPIM